MTELDLRNHATAPVIGARDTTLYVFTWPLLCIFEVTQPSTTSHTEKCQILEAIPTMKQGIFVCLS